MSVTYEDIDGFYSLSKFYINYGLHRQKGGGGVGGLTGCLHYEIWDKERFSHKTLSAIAIFAQF